MKQFLAYILLAITLSSCLKQTIPGAMLEKEAQSSGGSAISMSYQVNGVLVKTTVNDATNYMASITSCHAKKRLTR